MELEKRGVPTVTFVGDLFVVLANFERQTFGLPGLPLAVIDYPIGSVPPAEATRRALGAFDQILTGLTGQPAMAETAGKQVRA